MLQGHGELPHPDVATQRKVLCTVGTECHVGVKRSEWEEGCEQREGHVWSSGMKENVVSVKVNVAAAQRSGVTIQGCPDVRFVSVGAHLLDKRERNGVFSGHCTVAFTYVAWDLTLNWKQTDTQRLKRCSNRFSLKRTYGFGILCPPPPNELSTHICAWASVYGNTRAGLREGRGE